MNILVTGANGQLGNEMRVLAASHSQHTCYFTDAAELDVCCREAVMDYVRRYPVDCIVNCAAYTAVDRAESDAEFCERLNAQAPGFLAETAESCGAAMVQISTDYVFDGRQCRPYRETDRTCPVSVYGRTKREGEKAVMRLCSKAMVIRTAWLYSSFGNNFVKSMLRLGRERDSLGVVSDQIGTPTYARDLAEVIYVAIEGGIVPGVYHFSSEGFCSWYDFAKAIHRLAGITSCRIYPLHTEEYPSVAVRPHYSVLDKTKIKKTFGIAIPHWAESLEACIRLMEPDGKTSDKNG